MSRIPDLAAALERFLERVEPYDTAPGHDPVATVQVAGLRADLTAYTARALAAALDAYTDPGDRGRCPSCGSRRLDASLTCYDCGTVGGIFGATLAARAEHIRSWGATPPS
ncbi:hypothetical protein J2S43_007572 [Catenuloplanes nepalensis]|uniref:Uncharacterized protein n=1 Tax=Catenuloplanes nepalensis TaxID=587533 RepID=A0ABT9N5T0_9ACTN|nr:hypothetical protein [Catenuloplanes nepalensis]MDP9799060.1 hypothetical protein [Catenuloplanes nepalensis]